MSFSDNDVSLNHRSLTRFDGPVDGYSIIVPVSKPAFVGNAPSGVDWHCQKCGALLASSVKPGQLFDIMIRCYECDEIGALPQRNPGDPVAAQSVVLDSGMYLITDSIRAEMASVVSGRAVRDYEFEVGRRHTGQFGAALESIIINEENLRALAQKAADLLGADYEKLAASDRRGLSSPTPPPQRHRIVELITYARELADLRSNRAGLVIPSDAARLTELKATVDLFDRWKNHPAYAHLLATLKGDGEVSHTAMTLAVGSYLADAGNGVGIVHKDSVGRIPDIELLAAFGERAEIEIKSPSALHGPLLNDPSDATIEKIITRQLKSAASTRGGQLDSSGSGMLIIGGFHLSSSLMARLAAVGRKVLNGQVGRKKHLVGIAFFNLTALEVRLPAGDSLVIPTLSQEIVLHPSYAGSISLNQNPPHSVITPNQFGNV